MGECSLTLLTGQGIVLVKLLALKSVHPGSAFWHRSQSVRYPDQIHISDNDMNILREVSGLVSRLAKMEM